MTQCTRRPSHSDGIGTRLCALLLTAAPTASPTACASITSSPATGSE
jgi:hypothetical protein